MNQCARSISPTIKSAIKSHYIAPHSQAADVTTVVVLPG